MLTKYKQMGVFFNIVCFVIILFIILLIINVNIIKNTDELLTIQIKTTNYPIDLDRRTIDHIFKEATVVGHNDAILIQSNMKSSRSKCTLVDMSYYKVLQPLIVYGHFFYEEDAEKDYVVINESLANSLFGHDDCLGEMITVSDKELKIIGIVRDDNLGENRLFASIGVLKIPINDLVIVGLSYVDNALTIRSFKLSVAQNFSNYQVIDIAAKKETIIAIIKLLLIPLLAIALVIVTILINDKLRVTINYLKSEFEHKYLKNMIIPIMKYVFIYLLCYGLIALIIVLIFNNLRPDLILLGQNYNLVEVTIETMSQLLKSLMYVMNISYMTKEYVALRNYYMYSIVCIVGIYFNVLLLFISIVMRNKKYTYLCL